MGALISSARYTDLYDYARTAEQMDYELMAQADRLINRLSHFQATCREPGFQVHSSLGSALRSYATHALPIDQRVRTVGEGFQRADGSPWRLGSGSITGGGFNWRTLLGPALFPPLALAPLLSEGAHWVFASPGNAWSALETVAEPSASLLALLSIATKPSVLAGRVGVSAPNLSRWFLDLSAKHPYNATLVAELADPLGKSVLLGTAIQSIGQWYYDFHEFRDDKLAMVSAFVFDASLILVKTAAVTAVATGLVGATLALLGVSLATVPAVAVGVAIVAVGTVLGLAVDHFFLTPYLKGEGHSEHVQILADNLKEFGRDPVAFTKVFGSELGNRLTLNAREFGRDPVMFGKVFAGELAYAVDEGLGLRENFSNTANQLKGHADKLVDFITGHSEEPQACVAI